MMEFRILGCLQVVDGDRVIDIAADKQKVVLAVLLLRAGQTVPVPELQDQLWGETPPAKAKNTLQAYVYRLRHLLKFDSGSELVTETGGYRMVLAEGALDLHCFEGLAARGRAAVKAGRLEEGLAALRSALALWRGPACADVSATALQADVQRLEDLRVAVAEDAAEVALALGQQAAMVHPLETLVAAQPYRERLWALLMVALCGTGRQADALAAYGRVRARLTEDLGVEPGPHLRQLHRDILSGRSVGGSGHAEGFWLAGPATTGSRPGHDGDGRARPAAELPRDIATFVGRRTEVAQVCGWFTGAGPGRIGMISGPAGVGKSALAVHVAHRLADRFPHGQFYADLHGDGDTSPDPAQILRRWLPTLGVAAPPAGREEESALFRSALATRRALVVIDGATDLDQVSSLLPGIGASAALVTGRGALTTIDGCAHLTLRAADPDEALELLRRLAGPERVDPEPAAARIVVSLCDGLPLAIRIVAARLAARPESSLGSLADQLLDDRRRLDELAFGGLTLRPRIRAGYHRLAAADARTMFRILGCRPGADSRGVVVPELCTHTGWARPRVRAALEALADAQLVLALPHGRYRMPTLVRLVAAELAPGPRRSARPAMPGRVCPVATVGGASGHQDRPVGRQRHASA